MDRWDGTAIAGRFARLIWRSTPARQSHVVARPLVLAFSNSGASEETVAILPNLKLIGCAVIALVDTVWNEKICMNLEKQTNRQGA